MKLLSKVSTALELVLAFIVMVSPVLITSRRVEERDVDDAHQGVAAPIRQPQTGCNDQYEMSEVRRRWHFSILRLVSVDCSILLLGCYLDGQRYFEIA